MVDIVILVVGISGVFLNIMFFFFFKQKTAYDIRLSLVGSEMCIRDRYWKIRMGVIDCTYSNSRSRFASFFV